MKIADYKGISSRMERLMRMSENYLHVGMSILPRIRQFAFLRISGFASRHGDFPQNHFWEPVSGILFLGMPVKWGFLFPKNEIPVLPFLGILVFGDFPKK